MAKPFRFNLQKALEYREQLEEQAKMALARALAAVRDQKAVLDDLARRLIENEQAQAADKNLTVAAMWLYRNYKERLLQDVAQARLKLEALEEEAKRRRLELVSRAKDRKLLEKLKTNQAARHAREERLKEQNGFDEMATIRFARHSV